jgi:hypothetical protein
MEEFGLLDAIGNFVPYTRYSMESIITLWPNLYSLQEPPTINSDYERMWTMQADDEIFFAPATDGAYSAYLVGTFDISAISPANTVTYLSTFYPALLEAGCMVFLAGALRRNFGAQSDDPRSAMSWEQQFQTLLQGAKDEEIRRRGLRPNTPAPAPPPSARPRAA